MEALIRLLRQTLIRLLRLPQDLEQMMEGAKPAEPAGGRFTKDMPYYFQ